MQINLTGDNPSDEQFPVNVKVGELVTYTEPPVAKKRGRKKKTEVSTEGDLSVIKPNNEEEIPFVQSSTPYHDTYKETDAILRRSIDQLDAITSAAYQDLETIRSSKTMRNKYNHISDITSSMVSAIQGKVQAARELNNSIKNSHELDLKRMKELHLNEQRDDTRDIMDTYRAFISTPVSQNMTGPFQSPLGATTIDLTLAANTPNTPVQVGMLGQNPDAGYNEFVQNMTPEQMTMMIEENPDIKHVVTYDPTTGAADFAVYDSRTGNFLQGMPTRNREMYMDGMDFNFNTMQAHSNDLNETYEIIYVNQPTPVTEGEEKIIDPISETGQDMSNY